MTPPRLAGCLASWVGAIGIVGIAGPARAHFAPPGIHPDAYSINTAFESVEAGQPGFYDVSYGVFRPGARSVEDDTADLDDLCFRFEDGATTLPGVPAARDAGVVHITFAPVPGARGGPRHGATLVAPMQRAGEVWAESDLALARTPGLPVAMGVSYAPLPVDDDADPAMDGATLVASIAGVGMAISLITGAMTKLPR